MYPLTRNFTAPVVLVLLSATVTALQSWAGGAAAWMLWTNWAVTALLAFGVQDTLSRYYLGQVRNGAPFLVSWMVMLATVDYAMLHLPGDTAPWLLLVAMVCLLVVLRIVLSTWEQQYAVPSFFLLGLLVGGLSTLLPFVLGWLVLLPIVLYQMRAWSGHNAWSSLTGIVLGIWTVYCLLFLFGGEERADAMLRGYGRLLDTGLPVWPSLQWQEWMFIAFFMLLLASYSMRRLLLVLGDNIRSRANSMMLAMLSLVVAVLSVADLGDIGFCLGLLSLFLSLQMCTYLANVRSSANEWWIFILLVLFLLMSVLPTAFPLVMAFF